MEILAFIGTLTTSLVAWLAWVLAMALFGVAKKKIESETDGDLSAKLGKCLWMGLGAAVSPTSNRFVIELLLSFMSAS